MGALATVDDVTALGADPARVTDEMLAQASARFRSEAGGNQIEATEYTLTLRPVGGLVRLPFTPVIEVAAVNLLNDNGTTGTAVTGSMFNGIDTLDVCGVSSEVWVNGPSWTGDRTVRVEFTAGFDPIPEDVRWTVAQMVARAADAGPAGVTSEQIGDYSRSFGSFTASGAMSMTREEREVARRYRTRRASMDVPLG